MVVPCSNGVTWRSTCAEGGVRARRTRSRSVSVLPEKFGSGMLGWVLSLREGRRVPQEVRDHPPRRPERGTRAVRSTVVEVGTRLENCFHALVQ